MSTDDRLRARYPRGGRWVPYKEDVVWPGGITLKAMGYRYVPIATLDYAGACREAFRKVRRDVWSERESRLRATWESYG